MPERIFRVLLWVLLAGSAYYFHGTEDLWNDEIYTLKQFVLQGPAVIISDYHVPNNHIFANLLHWFWTKITGIHSGNYLSYPALLRIWPALLSVLTLWTLYRITERLAGPGSGFWAVLLTLTTISFQAFAFQIRGYPLTILLSAVVLLLLIQTTKERSFLTKKKGALAITTALLIWCIPANLYWIVALLTGCTTLLITASADQRRAIVWGIVPVLVGILGAVLLYLPVGTQLTSNRYVVSGPPFQPAHYENASNTLLHWLGTRWPLFIAVFIGLLFRWRQRAIGYSNGWALALLIAIILPCCLIAWRGDAAPMRTYWILFSSFIVLWSWAMTQVLRVMPAYWTNITALLLVVSYSYDTYAARQRLEAAFAEKIRYQDINFNYYQHYFAPNAELDEFQRRFAGKQLVLEDHEPHDMPDYLSHRGIPYVLADSLDYDAHSGDSIIVSTRFSDNYIRWMREDKRWTCSCMQSQIRYPRIVICRKQ
jgi:hypothetical protein